MSYYPLTKPLLTISELKERGNPVKVDPVRNKRNRALYHCEKPWPLVTHKAEQMLQPCRRCGCCLGNRRNDLTGRMIAESLRCYDVWVATLTYDDGKLGDEVIDGACERVPDHIKIFVNNLRKQGERDAGHRIELRYFAVYEKGKEKQRGHWHIILFWCSDADRNTLSAASVLGVQNNPKPAWMPAHEYRSTFPKSAYVALLNNPKVVDLAGGPKMRQHWWPWRHGVVTVHALFRGNHKRNQVHNAVSYCVKYCLKDRQRYLMSHKMGEVFYRTYIEDLVSAGLQLNDMTYSFADQQKQAMYNDRLKEKRSIEEGGQYTARNRRRVYQIQGVMRTRCVQYYIRLKRRKVKEFYRKKLVIEGGSVFELLPEIRRNMALNKMGAAVLNWQTQRERYRVEVHGEVLERLETKARVDEMIAQEVADMFAQAGYVGGYRSKNRVDATGPQYWAEASTGPAQSARFRALSASSKRK